MAHREQNVYGYKGVTIMTVLSPKRLKIEMVHDIVCSWCPIGYNNIKTAINNLNIDVDFHFLPFELNPSMADAGESIASYFNRQMGWGEQKLLAYQKSLVTTAANSGVNIDFSKRKYYYNTRNAHLLMHWAGRFNKQNILNERLITAYFSEGQDISNITVLLNIAQELGFDRREILSAITSTYLNQELTDRALRYKAFNISSIPAFIINNSVLIMGSNSVNYFEQALSKLNETSYVEQS